MTEDHSHRTTIGNHTLALETLMLGFGYDPALSEGAVKPPVFLTSTFVFRSAEEGRDYFDVVAGRKDAPAGGAGLVYSRFNHPNSEIVEDRLAIWEAGESALLFASGMAAIATVLLAHVRPGDAVLHSQPLYGGTETLLAKTLAPFGIAAEAFHDGLDAAAIAEAAARAAARGRIAAILVETPSNPLNSLVDFALVAAEADRIAARQGGARPVIVCDNTMLGPVFQQPLRHGVDIVVSSLTKYVGGHSDLIAGAAIGSRARMRAVRLLRGAIGTQLDPHSCWMLGRSLETVGLRMRAAAANAEAVAGFLADHPRIEAVHALGRFAPPAARAVYGRQCSGGGSTFSLEVAGGQAAAFRVLNALRVVKLAVSLGGTESLASHPASTTHSGVPAEVRARIGVTEGLIRLSIGIEHVDDLIADLAQALDAAG